MLNPFTNSHTSLDYLFFVVSGLPYFLWSFLYTAKSLQNTIVLKNSEFFIHLISYVSTLCRSITIGALAYNYFIVKYQTFHELLILKCIALFGFLIFGYGLYKTLSLLGLYGTFYGAELGHTYIHCNHWIYRYIPHPMYLCNNGSCLSLVLLMPTYNNLVIYIINTLGFIITIFNENIFCVNDFEKKE
jgi:hypothetical protein